MVEPVARRASVYRGEGSGRFQRCAWNTGRGLSKLITAVLFRLRVQGQENVPADGPVLLVTNHQSFLDPWLIGVHLRRQIHYMARDTLFKGGFLTWLMELLNSFPVKRGAADLQAIRETVQRLDQGHMVNIFPEGTRTIPGKPVKFQRGVAAIALHSGASILPVTLGCSPTTLTKREKWYEIPPRKFILSLHVGHDIEVGPIDKNAGRSLATRNLTRQLEQYFIEQLAHHGKP